MSKMGFRLVYHKDIPQDDMRSILDFLERKRLHFSSEGGYKVGYANSSSFYRRGIFGLGMYWADPPNNKYTFRRLVKNRRIFGIVPISELEGVDGPVDINQCMCAEHGGGQKVKLKGGFKESDWIQYCELGDIKG